jgi:small subunit ribosomal protein S19
MARSLWKGPFCEISPEIEKVQSRRSLILPEFIGKNLLTHNGKSFISLKVSQDMIGHKFGEFAITRKKPKHPTLRKNITKK